MPDKVFFYWYSVMIKKTHKSKTTKRKSRRKKKKKKEIRWVLSLLYARLFKCIGIPMKAHCGTQIRNTHTDTQSNTRTHTVHMSCVQFRFYVLCFFSSFWFASLCLNRCCFFLHCDFATHTSCLRRNCEPTEVFHSHYYCAPQYRIATTNKYLRMCSARV